MIVLKKKGLGNNICLLIKIIAYTDIRPIQSPIHHHPHSLNLIQLEACAQQILPISFLLDIANNTFVNSRSPHTLTTLHYITYTFLQPTKKLPVCSNTPKETRLIQLLHLPFILISSVEVDIGVGLQP